MATKALVSNGMDQDSVEALAEMQAKHQQVEEAVLPPGENTNSALLISQRQVYNAIRSFKAGSAAGPSGLEGKHLKEARGRGGEQQPWGRSPGWSTSWRRAGSPRSPLPSHWAATCLPCSISQEDVSRLLRAQSVQWHGC